MSKAAERTPKPFAALSANEVSDLKKAKSEMSIRFLHGAAGVELETRAFRAAPRTAKAMTYNVVGVGVDEKYVDGVPTGRHVVKFLVRTKLPLSGLSKAELLPKSVAGFDTDVEEVGLIVPQAKTPTKSKRTAAAAAMPNPRKRIRPIQPGSSVGFREPSDAFIMAGTFGLLVKDAHGALFILSNNHVLAFESGYDAGGNKREALPVGAPIFQPGLLDGGRSTDNVAELAKWVDLRADKPGNKVDGALAKLTPQNGGSRDILYIGAPTGQATAAVDMVVHKFGRTTSYRVGRVSSTTFDLTIPYEVGNVLFEDQIAIRGLNGRKFSDAGDSGSAILDRGTNKVIGLLFAGTTSGIMTFANHISDVFHALKVALA